jgi:uncharacterized protein YdhG (YjbR/CyaY superfamily)
MTSTKKPARSNAYARFSVEERAAMKDHAEELKAASRRGPAAARADGEGNVLAKIAEMDDADRAIAEQVHVLVTAAAPEITPRLWYGMPSYALDGKIACYLQAAKKVKTRYATLGFSDRASLDDGSMWPVVYALPELTAASQKRISALVRQAVS